MVRWSSGLLGGDYGSCFQMIINSLFFCYNFLGRVIVGALFLC